MFFVRWCKSIFQFRFRIIRYTLFEDIDFTQRNIKYPSDIRNNLFCLKRTECDNMSDLLITVVIPRILDNALPTFEAHIHIKVGHAYTFRIKKSFEYQFEPEWIYIGYRHCIRDKGTGS